MAQTAVERLAGLVSPLTRARLPKVVIDDVAGNSDQGDEDRFADNDNDNENSIRNKKAGRGIVINRELFGSEAGLQDAVVWSHCPCPAHCFDDHSSSDPLSISADLSGSDGLFTRRTRTSMLSPRQPFCQAWCPRWWCS